MKDRSDGVDLVQMGLSGNYDEKKAVMKAVN